MAKLFGTYPEIDQTTFVAVDTETTGLAWQDAMLGYSLAWRVGDRIESCYVVPGEYLTDYLGGEVGVIDDEIIIDVLFSKQTIFHSLGFDYRVLYRKYHVPAPWAPHDVSVLAKLVGFFPELSLEGLHVALLGPYPEKMSLVKNNRSKLQKMPIADVAEYARYDAVTTLLLFEELLPRLKEAYTSEAYYRDLQFSRLVMDMLARGLPVDRDNLHTRRREMTNRCLELQQIWVGRGVANLGSVDQLSKHIFEVSGFSRKGLGLTAKTGRPRITNELLDEWSRVPGYENLQEMVEYRELTKALSSWYYDLLLMSAEDGKAHSILAPFGTRSFRMSSSEINLQAMPMEERGGKAYGSLKGAFVSDLPDQVIWAVDIKQAEVRLAGMLANDPALGKAFDVGKQDVYTSMSQEVWGTPDRRTDAKRATLSSIYEIGAKSFSIKYKVPEQEASRLLDEFRARFQGIRRASKHYEKEAVNLGYVKLISGKRRYFGPFDEMYMAFNQRVQGSLADMMEEAMLRVEQEFPGRLLLQIHDSLVMYMPKDKAERDLMVAKIGGIIDSSLPDWVRAKVNIPMLVDDKAWG